MLKKLKLNRFLGILLSTIILVSQWVPIKVNGENVTNAISVISREKLSFTPTSMVQDPNDTVLYMTDVANKRVVAYNYVTNTTSYVQFQLQPENITYANGEIYVCLLKGAHDINNTGGQQGAVAIIDGSTIKTGNPAVKEQFDIDIDPYGITADTVGNIYISTVSSKKTNIKCYNRTTKQLISESHSPIYAYSKGQTNIKYNAANNKIYYYSQEHVISYYSTSTSLGSYSINNGQISWDGQLDGYSDSQRGDSFALSPEGKYIITPLGSVYMTGLNKYEDRIFIKNTGQKYDDYTFNSEDNLIYGSDNKRIAIYDYKNFNFLDEYYLDNIINRLFYKDDKLIALTKDINNTFYIEVMAKPVFTAMPYLIASSIEDGSINIPLTNEIVLTFSENIHFIDNNRFRVSDGINGIDNTQIIDGNKLTIKFNNGMEYNKLYEIRGGGAIANDSNVIANVPAVIKFTTEKTQGDNEQIKHIYSNNLIIDKDTTINGDIIVNPYTELIIKTGAKLRVTGSIVNYNTIINYGDLVVDGNIYCESISQDSFNFGAGILFNKGSVNKENSKNYPEPYNSITPSGEITTDKGYVEFSCIGQNGFRITTANETLFESYDYDTLRVRSRRHQLKIGDNNVTVYIEDNLGHKYQKSILVHCTATPLKVLNVYPTNLTDALQPIFETVYVQFDDEVSPSTNFEDITYNFSSAYGEIIADNQGKKTILRIRSSIKLNYNSKYTIKIPCDAVKGVSNSQVMASDYSTSFTTDSEYTRLAGNNRYATSVSICKNGWKSSNTVVLATGENFPDALSAAPLAAKYDAPILLTETNRLTSEVKDEIKRLGAGDVIIIGGTGAVSTQVENELLSMGVSCRRIFGKDRFETSVKISKELGAVDTAIIATGLNFPDALSIAPFAAAYQIPILLTDNSNIPDSVRNYISSTNVQHTIVVGGSGVISDVAKNSLPDPQRLAGANRYQTNFQIISAFKADLSTAYFATGINFPDALAGAPLAAQRYSPVILVDKGMDQDIFATWRFYNNKYTVKKVLGGTGAVSQDLIDSIIYN